MTNTSFKTRVEERRSRVAATLSRFANKHLQCLGNLRFLNGLGQSCFMVGLIGIAGWGVCVAIPFLYSNESWTGTYVQALGCFIAFQLTVNWICIKTVDSAYIPYKHGVKPSHIEVGENITLIRDPASSTSNGHTGTENVRSRKETGSVMYVAIEFPSSPNEAPKRTAFQYLSWTPCLLCNRLRPPRCHHCPSCNRCVMKRDHHCFVTGACVGYYNLRHFVVFLTWASCACVFATIHAVVYCYYDIYDFISGFDLFLPVAVFKYVLGHISLKHTLLIALGWLLIGFLCWSISFLRHVIEIVSTGKTSFEQQNKFVLYDTRSAQGKLEAVFGRLWWMNFILPLHFVFKPIDDPVLWPFIRAG